MKKKVTTSLPRLLAAANEPMRVGKVIPLDVQLGDLRVKDWFEVVDSLAVEVLLGTSFIDRFCQEDIAPRAASHAHEVGARADQ